MMIRIFRIVLWVAIGLLLINILIGCKVQQVKCPDPISAARMDSIVDSLAMRRYRIWRQIDSITKAKRLQSWEQFTSHKSLKK